MSDQTFSELEVEVEADLEAPQYEEPNQNVAESVENDSKERVRNVRYGKFIAPLKNKIFNVVFFGLVVVTAVGWTHYKLTNAQSSVDYERELYVKESALQAEIMALNEKISAYNVAEMSQNKIEAEASVFSGYLEIADWLYQLSQHAAKSELIVEYQLFDGTEDSDLPDTLVVPMDMSVTAMQSSATDKIYQQFLTFMQTLIDEQKYKKFVAASIENVGNNSAKLSLKLEIRKRKDNMSTSSSTSNNEGAQGTEEMVDIP